MALLSPGIQIFESSVTPAAATAPAENGVATLGFSKKGPTNTLVRVRSVSEFTETFGEPWDKFPYAHILTQSVLANGTDVYFMRLADATTEAIAQCPVLADLPAEAVKLAVSTKVVTDVMPATYGNLTMLWNSTSENVGAPAHESALKLRIELDKPGSTTNEKLFAYAPAYFTKKFGGITLPQNQKGVLYVSTYELLEGLKAGAGDYYDFVLVNKEGEVGILIKAKSPKYFADGTIATIASSVGYLNGDNWLYLEGSNKGTVDGTKAEDAETVSYPPEILTDDEFGGVELSTQSTLTDVDSDNDFEKYTRFNITAKYSGSDMNGVKVVKTTVKSSVSGAETWTVSVYNKGAQQPIETRTGITSDNFLSEMSKFNTITIKDQALGEGKDEWEWVDGTWELGVGLILSDGESWVPEYPDGTPEEDKTYVAIEGDDGFPTVMVDGEAQYSESKAVNLYLEALGKDDFVNTEEYSYSILATPGTQSTLVQNAAINVCTTRGDAIYLADIPRAYCEDKQGIDEAVAWANGNSGFQSSYCAIYYGWFAQTNPYDTDNSIMCPASCFIAPKMVALDQSMGEFFAPAGIARGGLICSDWTYSPDQKDRDKLVGNDNVVNPISYSNTRGVTIMAQKTTDRTTSPLNRVGIRRMTNAIKRNLRSQLVALLFEPNNEIARAKARVIVDDILSNLRTRECIETYDINVVSGTGAARNELNVYLSYAPYGLIEKIYVYLSITDAGVEVTETVA